MSNRKISEFPAGTSVPSGSYFEYVYSGTNYKILDSNFYGSLGVTGTIVQDGAATGTPVLDKVGTVNNIRNIEAGAGIVAGVSAENGISLASGLQQNTSGITIIDDISTATPTAVSLLAGTGIEYNKSGNAITITATGATATTKRVTITELADFPAPSGGIITLAADTEYFLDGDINIGSNRFQSSNNVIIKGYGTNLSSITSTTSGDLFTISSGHNFRCIDFAVNAASARVFNGTGGGFEDLYLASFTINSCTTIGALSNWYSFFWDKGAAVSFTNPLSFSGACTINIVDLVSFITGYTTAIDLGTATFNTCIISRSSFSYASATNHVIVAASSANLNSVNEGYIWRNKFKMGATNIVANFDNGDVQWVSYANENLSNTQRNAHAYMHVSTTTTIGSGDGDAGNPKKLNGATNWLSDSLKQFSLTTDGRLTYNGIEPETFHISAGVTGTVAASNAGFAFYLAKNGTVITASKSQRDFTSGNDGAPMPILDVVELVSGDYIEIFVENQDNLQDWVSSLVNITVARA